MPSLAEVGSNFLLFFLVFGMSATVNIDKLRKQLGNRYALLTGISLQFVILPFVGFMVVRIFNFPPAVGITLLVVTSSPGGSYSNWCVSGVISFAVQRSLKAGQFILAHQLVSLLFLQVVFSF